MKGTRFMKVYSIVDSEEEKSIAIFKSGEKPYIYRAKKFKLFVGKRKNNFK